MSRNHFPLKWKIFPIISIVFQTIFRITFCEGELFWCGNEQEEALTAVNGRNVSVRLNLTNPLTENQPLVWAKLTLDNQLVDNIDRISANQRRYSLKKETGENSFDLFIAFTELSDSGMHVVKIHNGQQSLCTVAFFNLIIEGTEPICSTLFDQETQRVQMSCEWVQDNLLGDQVQLLAGNQVVYAYETPEMNIDGDFDLTNKLSVYLPLENLHDGRVVPNMCLISNNNRSVNQACTFLPIQDQPLRSVFECCTTAEADAVKFWYNNGSTLLPLLLTDKLSFIHVGHFSFFCGVQGENNSVLLHSIGSVNLAEGMQYNISLSALGRTEGFNKSNENLRCENISFEVTNIDNTDTHHQEENQELNTMTTNTETIEVYKATWVWVILVFSVVFCFATGAVICYYIVSRKYRHHIGKEINYAMQMDSTVAIGDTSAQSEDMGNAQIQALQGRRDSGLRGATALQGSLGEGRHNQNQVRKTPISNHQDGPPSLHSQRQRGEPESSCFAHRPTNYTSNRDDHEGAAGRITTGSDTNPDKHIVHGLGSRPYPDTTYSSVDDVNGTSEDISKKHRPSNASSFPYAHPSPKDHFNMKASKTTSPPFKSGRSQQNTSMASMARVPGVDADVDALYTKPDMSRKTNRVTYLESDYDDSSPPATNPVNYSGRNPDQDTRVLEHDSDSLFLTNTEFYGNMFANPTDELTDGEELYASAH